MKTDSKRQLLPQGGTGNGQSSAVATPPVTGLPDGGVATVRPAYSGGGENPPCALRNQRLGYVKRTDDQAKNEPTTNPTTLTAPDLQPCPTTANKDSDITMTSVAMAVPPPDIKSAWANVESKHKRKKPKRKRNKTDLQTASPSGTRLSGQTSKTERTTTVTGKAQTGGLYGQSGGQSAQQRLPPAETVVPRPGTSRSTAVVQKISGENLPAEPAKPTLDATCANTSGQRQQHPVAPRCNKHWRGRSGGGADEDRNPNPSNSQPSLKRGRLDDSISPRGQTKRTKTIGQTRTRESYAGATQQHLSVAITLVPRADMTQTEAMTLQEQIQEEVFEACLRDPIPGVPLTHAPTFSGKAFLSEGVLKMWCEDDQALQWLNAVLPRLNSRREGFEIKIINQREITKRVKGALYVPNYRGEIGKLHRILLRQNPKYDIGSWTLHNFKRSTGRLPGVFLILGIPQEKIDTILDNDRRVAYSTGTIYLKFFVGEELSDMPPSQATSTKQDNTETDAAAKTITQTVCEKLPDSVQDGHDSDTTCPGPSTAPSTSGMNWEGTRPEPSITPSTSGMQWEETRPGPSITPTLEGLKWERASGTDATDSDDDDMADSAPLYTLLEKCVPRDA
ncbi:uncharacterized protein LOC128199186 [Bicyclus anynana]|uniref:Uncharacterized protein LOC128199186 n=1 Tax=Bicyclus anynana TaxID=110368 RepID=A0ABM3LWU9_BICAN|nr:uncharacterized protein LOC128199186 [Bicyclus anynana]